MGLPTPFGRHSRYSARFRIRQDAPNARGTSARCENGADVSGENAGAGVLRSRARLSAESTGGKEQAHMTDRVLTPQDKNMKIMSLHRCRCRLLLRHRRSMRRNVSATVALLACHSDECGRHDQVNLLRRVPPIRQPRGAETARLRGHGTGSRLLMSSVQYFQ